MRAIAFRDRVAVCLPGGLGVGGAYVKIPIRGYQGVC